MTREEAIQVIRVEIEPLSYRQAEALDMAISALSAEHKDCTDFLCWLLEEVMDEEEWKESADANGEIIARKLKKLGLLDFKDGYYVRTPMYEALAELSVSTERVVRCKDCEYRVHCHQTVSHTKIHEDFKEYWAEPIDFCSRAKMKGDM